ncbi:MAG: hypothetical protein PHU12_00310 [Candidatus Aenigmarchaeota archaeon]|nr:hypothetical protein [Candidatus Aenigmarchaeota archaeon]
MFDRAVVTYLKRFDGDHPEREALAKKVENELKKSISTELINLADNETIYSYKGAIIGVGGDGVFLGSTHSFRHLQNEYILIGTEGRSTAHYAESNHKKYKKDLKQIVDGAYLIRKATRIVAETHSYETWNLINEAAFLPSQPGRTFNYEMKIETEHYYKQYYGSCTNLLFATPCGSAAWSASAGGPIVREDGLIVITPESPIYTAVAGSKNGNVADKDNENLLRAEVVPSKSKIELKLQIPTTMIEDGRYWLPRNFDKENIFKIREGSPLKMIELDKTYK